MIVLVQVTSPTTNIALGWSNKDYNTRQLLVTLDNNQNDMIIALLKAKWQINRTNEKVASKLAITLTAEYLIIFLSDLWLIYLS